jgi:hypothetical protein
MLLQRILRAHGAAVWQLLCRQASLCSCGMMLLLLQDEGVGGVHQAQLAGCSTSAVHTADNNTAKAVNSRPSWHSLQVMFVTLMARVTAHAILLAYY